MALALMMAAMPALAQSTFTLKAPQTPVASNLQGAIHITPDQATAIKKAPAKAEANEDLAMVVKYCQDPYSAYSINTGTIGLGVMFPKSMLAEYKGGTITSINVCSPVNGRLSQSSFVNGLTECTVYITEGSLEGERLSETKGTISSEGYATTPVTLSTPYTITGDENVYICVMWDNVTSNDFPIVADGIRPENNFTGYLYSRLDYVGQDGRPVLKAESGWKQFNNYVGNICLSATVKGDFLPQNRAVIFLDQAPASVKPGEKFNYLVLVRNEGANTLTDVDLSLKIGDEPVQTVNSKIYNNSTGDEMPIANSEYGLAYGEFVCNTESQDVPYTAYVSKTNGADNEYASTTYAGSLVCLSKGYPMNVVVEELTSTTCVYCPMGITGMETMKEKYGADGRFIPIAVHCPVPSQGDPMNVCRAGYGYNDFFSDVKAANGGGASAPAAYIMRRFNNLVSPTPENLEKEFNVWKEIPAVVEVKAALSETADPTKVKLDVDVTPAIDLTGNYGISYTIVEDNVGPYQQQNGFVGYSDDKSYGWGSKPSLVTMKFNDVARRGSTSKPVADFEATDPKADTKLSYSTTVDLSYVTELQNYSVVAMCINKDNGHIENACIVKSLTNTSVEGIEAEANGPVAVGMPGALQMLQAGNVYSVDGRMVAKDAKGIISLPAGIYLVAAPNGNAKVMVR